MSYIPKMVEQTGLELSSPGDEGMLERLESQYIPKMVCSKSASLQGECAPVKAVPVALVAPTPEPEKPVPVVEPKPPAQPAPVEPAAPAKPAPVPPAPKAPGSSKIALWISLGVGALVIIVASIIASVKMLSSFAPKKVTTNTEVASDSDVDCFSLGDGPAFQECMEAMEESGRVKEVQDERASLMEMFAKVNIVEVSSMELSSYSGDELRLIRNSIFARHGYVFQSDDLKAYFSQFDWYKPRYSDVSSSLSAIERKNIKTIKSME